MPIRKLITPAAAAQWARYQQLPVIADYAPLVENQCLIIDDDKDVSTTKEVYYHILTGGITVYSFDYDTANGVVQTLSEQEHDGYAPCAEPPDYSNLDWYNRDGNTTLMQAASGSFYRSYLLSTVELIKLLPLGLKPPQQLPHGEYVTPYIEIMQQAIEHFGITEKNQPKVTEELVPWFREKISELPEENEDRAGSKAKMMATFVRMPASQRGGLKPSPRKG